jgi:2-polyprenyl-3-methyl-5-hydroxy-6-metoxy-1,4-benzoquinol methylase
MSPSQESYDPRYFEPLFAAEERHFWFVARNKVICSLAKKALKQVNGVDILEVGCGTGNVLQALEKDFPGANLTGMDLFQEGLQFARRRVHCGLVQADLADPPFNRQFDLLGMFDVLEHIQEDRRVLAHAFEQVKPGGWLLLTVPAEPKLWSYFDVASHHVRRYTLQELNEKVQQSGFAVEFSSPYIAATYPLVWLTRNTKEKSGSNDELSVQNKAEDELKIIPVVNEIIRGVLSLEADWLFRGRKLPFGSSLVMLARKSFIEP